MGLMAREYLLALPAIDKTGKLTGHDRGRVPCVMDVCGGVPDRDSSAFRRRHPRALTSQLLPLLEDARLAVTVEEALACLGTAEAAIQDAEAEVARIADVLGKLQAEVLDSEGALTRAKEVLQQASEQRDSAGQTLREAMAAMTQVMKQHKALVAVSSALADAFRHEAFETSARQIKAADQEIEQIRAALPLALPDTLPGPPPLTQNRKRLLSCLNLNHPTPLSEVTLAYFGEDTPKNRDNVRTTLETMMGLGYVEKVGRAVYIRTSLRPPGSTS